MKLISCHILEPRQQINWATSSLLRSFFASSINLLFENSKLKNKDMARGIIHLEGQALVEMKFWNSKCMNNNIHWGCFPSVPMTTTVLTNEAYTETLVKHLNYTF